MKNNYVIMSDNMGDLPQSFYEEHQIPVIDIHEATRNHPEYFLLDGIHPDSAGAEAIARNAFSVIQKHSK